MRFRVVYVFLLCSLALSLTACNMLMRVLMSTEEPPEGQEGLARAGLQEGALAVVAEGLQVPWELAFLPDGSFLVSERLGRVTKFPRWEEGDEPLRPEDGEVWIVAGVLKAGEGGLMGLAVHPGYSLGDPAAPPLDAPTSSLNQWVYLMFSAEGSDGVQNRVERFRVTEQGLVDPVVIVEEIPGNRFHDGGRIAFGPDGYLYITTGDAGDSSRSQDLSSLGGKILRLDHEGGIPPTNPFESAVWSLGHRNPQGLAWDDEGRLWSTEHGRSGLRSGMDELNLVRAGENYGWPIVEGDEESGLLRAPVIHSGEEYTWAPGGVALVGERLFFGGLRGEALYEVRLDEGAVTEFVAHFASELGRIRAMVAGPDGMLYLTTSNRDGRGAVRDGDDKILRIDPSSLSQ